MLQQRNDVTDNEVRSFSDQVCNHFNDLNQMLNDFKDEEFVPMTNIDTIEELRKAVVTDGKFPVPGGNIFENGEFDNMMNALEESIMHCQRIDQKSIAIILEEHKKIQEKNALA